MSEHAEADVVLEAPGLLLRVGPSGSVEASDAVSGVAWLVDAGVLEVVAATGPLALGSPQVRADADEVEVEVGGDGLRALVRHAVDEAWTVRVVLVNESHVALELTGVRLRWRPAPGAVATALAAGAVGAYAVQPASGSGRLLVGRLRAGVQTGVDEDGLLLGPLTLPPGHRAAVQWRWEVLAEPRLVDRSALPATPWLELGQSVVLPAGPDVAVVAPGLHVEVGEDAVRVEAFEPGPATVELRGVRGTITHHLVWAPDLDDLLDSEAAALLAGPTTPSGTVRLPGAAAALVVQDALRRGGAGSGDVATEALELATGLLVEQLDEHPTGAAAVDPLALALLAREADRVAGPTARATLDAATRGLRGVALPAPGVGLAGVALALARLRSGEDPAPAVDHLAGLLRASSPASDAGLELAVLLRPGHVTPEALVAGLRRLGAALGAGLPGRSVPPAGLERLALASAVLGLVDEATGERLRTVWGTGAAEVARRASAQVRARVAERPGGAAAGRALAWLVLGGTPA